MNKISIIFVTLVLIISSMLIIIPNNNIIKADSITSIPDIDTDLIYKISAYLSDIINKTYGVGELEKGREFGTEGEWEAANYTAEEMADLNLYDPTPNPNRPYQEQIDDAWYPLRVVGYGNEKINAKIDIHARCLTINDTLGSSSIIDWYLFSLGYAPGE